MSGIFGLYFRNQQAIDKNILVDMGASMMHRGPDGMEVWLENNIGMGNCIFHTTPESVGKKQPWFDNEQGLVITADARIDARDDLARKLGLFNRLRNGISDCELLLAAYTKWQTKCVHHLIGDFAFLIWDQKEQHIFCARDHLGVKPFYYHVADNIFVAASEVRSILKVPQVPNTINQGRIADYLVDQLEGIDKISTFYEGISRLPPAHSLIITNQKISINKYWELDPEFETQYQSDNEYVEAFHEIFKESVSDRLRGNGEVTSMLSGGLDSSYIVATAKQLNQMMGKPPLITYSGVTENDAACRETHFIKSVISQGGLNPITVTTDDIAAYEQELMLRDASLEELFDTYMTMPRLFYLMARDRGQRVMLDGVDGDLVHSLSTSYPTSLIQNGHYLRAISESFDIWRNSFRKETSLYKLLEMTIRAALVPDWLRKWRQRLPAKSMLEINLQATHINRDFSIEVDIESRLSQLHSHNMLSIHASLREKHVQSIMHPYLTVALERYDRVAAACSIEPRHPLLDKRLVEFSVSLPWDQIVRNGWSKFIIRRAAESNLRGEVAWRQGWDSINWTFTSALVKKRHQFMTKRIVEQQSILSKYIDSKMLQFAAENKEYIASYDDECLIYSIYHLADKLQSNL
ncbi:MAG: hypothetical protein DRQ48_02905 [Gammaproteobacteria bacterium]|nr:MAG: hypothetical protein DRQ48_02905 [Gammaproteobacteria bacterium]